MLIGSESALDVTCSVCSGVAGLRHLLPNTGDIQRDDRPTAVHVHRGDAGVDVHQYTRTTLGIDELGRKQARICHSAR